MAFNRATSPQPPSGWNDSLAPIPEAPGDVVSSPAPDVEGRCGVDSSGGVSSGPMRSLSQPVRNANIVDSHGIATIDARIIAD